MTGSGPHRKPYISDKRHSTINQTNDLNHHVNTVSTELQRQHVGGRLVVAPLVRKTLRMKKSNIADGKPQMYLSQNSLSSVLSLVIRASTNTMFGLNV